MDSTRTSGFVACSQVQDAGSVAQAVRSLVGDVGYVVTVKADDVRFRRLTEVSVETEVPLWDEGRAFSVTAELRWKRTAKGSFSLLLLTEDEQKMPRGWEPVGEGWSVIPHDDKESMRVWGERKVGPSSWVETRIPRVLDYPVAEATQTVQISWVEYRDNQNSPRLLRLKEVRDASR